MLLPALWLTALLAVVAAAPSMAAAPAYADLDAVLLRNVRNGFVDYDGIAADPAFGRFVTSLEGVTAGDLSGPGHRAAFVINTYNALVIQSVLDGAVPAKRAWRGLGQHQYRVLGQQVSLRELDREGVAELADPRARFAIACGSLSCPRLASHAYRPDTVDRQLDAAVRSFANDSTRNRFDVERRIAFLSPLFERYRPEFERSAGSLQRYLGRYISDPRVAEVLARDGFELRFSDYDATLNGIYRSHSRGTGRH